jgi:hypothetical protein
MQQFDVEEFSSDDTTYQQWLDQHPNGFVINTGRKKQPEYMVLHKTSCPHIKNYTKMARSGGFTERDFIKVCSDSIDSLKAWTKQNGRPDGSFSSECSQCKPVSI